MNDPILIYQGQYKEIIARAVKKDGSFLDISSAQLITACFIPAGTSHISPNRLVVKGDTASGSALISNIADTSLLTEGMQVTGAGIPLDTDGNPIKIIATPNSVLPIVATAPGVVQIAANATATATQINLTMGNVEIVDGPNGLYKIKLFPVDTAKLKLFPALPTNGSFVVLGPVPNATLGGFESSFVIAGKKEVSQTIGVLNVIKSLC